MRTKLAAWGNSQAVRLPKDLLDELQFHPGDELILEKQGNAIILKKAHERLTLEELIERYGPLHLSDEVDWGDPVGDEVEL